jgi:uncharacterized membrane protein YkvA (DUF1232 family)
VRGRSENEEPSEAAESSLPTEVRRATARHLEHAKVRAMKVLADREATEKLVDAAERKTNREKSGRLNAVWQQTTALLRLLRAYAVGEYRAVSWESLLLIAMAIIYFVSPVDAIPDFLPVGLMDDAAVIAFVITVVNEELNDFIDWERTTKARGTDSAE